MNAKVSAVSIEITCPKCDSEVPHTHSGSLYWAVNELPEGNTVMCPFCRRQLKVKVPKDTK